MSVTHDVSTPAKARDGGALSEFQIAQRVAIERGRLLREAGLETEPPDHFTRPAERTFTKGERGQVTLLFGGLTHRHDRLIRAATRNLGYCVEVIPTPVKRDFQTGKEYGNNGQCNPTYFTVGALVNYLRRLRDEAGLSTSEILEKYIFVTAGACGPCRFGMYEAEFRLALRNSGFDGFRVLLFQQKGGLLQSDDDYGLELNIDFALALLNALVIGDILNELACQVRPYEVVPGRTDAVFEEIRQMLEDRLASRSEEDRRPPWWARAGARMLSPLGRARDVEKILAQLNTRFYTDTLAACRQRIDREVEVDYLRVKPVCKITGEFWAQTTEGDGNYHMFRFLESQGAEVLVEPITTWVNYMITQEVAKRRDRKGLDARGFLGRLKAELGSLRDRVRFGLATRLLNREYDRVRHALGGTTHAQICQLELQRLGHPYYNRKTGGGEGHLEVAKNIYYGAKGYAHMVMSLKPFGCMPSAQSDGAQAAVVAQYPDLNFIPIETSGEGDVNAHSRAQMALGEAKTKAKAEFAAALAETGYTLDEIRAYCAEHPELRRPLQRIDRTGGVAGKAANFVRHVAKQMNS